MENVHKKRFFCIILAALLLLSGCGRRQASGGESNTQKDSGYTPVVQAADALQIRNDEVIQSHLAHNRTLSTQRNDREADTFHFYIENVESMAGFVSGNVTTDYQESIQSLMDVAYNNFGTLAAHRLAYSEDLGLLEWEDVVLDKPFIRQMQTQAFYAGNVLPETSPLVDLTWGSESPFAENALSVILSNFVEPGNDLSALSVEIESYFDKYENSAACLMGLTSHFEGDFHIPSDGGSQTTYRITDFVGDAPFYMVMVGPELVVRQTAQNLQERLTTKGITPSCAIYTNNVYAQILEEPLTFDVIGDLKAKKAPFTIVRSYNTGELYEDDGGNAYFATSSGRVETLDSSRSGNVSTSTQISLMSKDYDGAAEYGWDFTLYSYDAATGAWVEAGKNALSSATVVVELEEGPLLDSLSNEPILTSGRKEIRVSAKLDFGSTSALSRDQIYRVEVRLHLNRENAQAQSSASSSNLRDYSITRADYDSTVNRLSDGWGNTKIWTASPRLHASIQEVLLRTPNLGDLLTSLEQLEQKYHDDSEMIEYIDFVFNVPQNEPEQ